MTTPSLIRASTGLRFVQLLGLNTNNYPNATLPAQPYEGIQLSTAQVLTLTDPDPKFTISRSDQTAWGTTSLPPDQPILGSITTHKIDDNVDALVTSQNAYTIGEANAFLWASDKRGQEPAVCMLAYQAAIEISINNTHGLRRWEFVLFPQVKLVPRMGNLGPDTAVQEYALKPRVVNSYPWGTVFTTAIEGALQAQYVRGVCENKPKLVAWYGDSTTVIYPFLTQAANGNNVSVWKNGVQLVPGTDLLTVTSNYIILATPPSNGDMLVCFYGVN